MACCHNLMTPDLVVRASVDEARLTNTPRASPCPMARKASSSPPQQTVSKILFWSRKTKQERMNLSLYLY